MNDRGALELRVAALIRAYADRAPIEVDPIAMARLTAASSHDGVATRFGYLPAGRLVFALLVLALVAAMAGGALLAGRFLQRDAEDLLTRQTFVEPFNGLPPEGAAPSSPETGELVVSFGGRITSLGLDFHRMWLFTDGRLIWKSNLEGSSAGWKLRFGSSEPTTALIEQRLTPEGVDLIRSYVEARVPDPRYPTGDYPPYRGISNPATAGPGVLWGYMSMTDGDQIVPVTWSDYDLPGRLADPASWLPASAWEDRRIGAYIPSRYAVCLGQAVPAGVTGLAPTDLRDLLPEPTRHLIRSKALEDPAPDWNEHDAGCIYQVSTGEVRAISAAFDEAGFQQDSLDVLSYEFPIGHEFPGVVQLLVITPNGEAVCYCG